MVPHGGLALQGESEQGGEEVAGQGLGGDSASFEEYLVDEDPTLGVAVCKLHGHVAAHGPGGRDTDR